MFIKIGMKLFMIQYDRVIIANWMIVIWNGFLYFTPVKYKKYNVSHKSYFLLLWEYDALSFEALAC